MEKIIFAAALTALVNFGTVEAAEIDNELAIIAAEQSGEEILNPAQNQDSDTADKKKLVENNQPEVFEPAKPTEEIISVTEEVVSEPVAEKVSEPVAEKVSEPVVEKVSEPVAEKVYEPVAEKVSEPEQEVVQPISLPTPIKTFATFADVVKAVNFTPLYIPKKSGYTMNEIATIANRTVEIRYGRRWEPEVSLQIRTYKRAAGEELTDISGVHGVKWRIDTTSGSNVYIAKIDERSHVATWASGSYIFSAYVENLSFAAFHSLVIDELVDLTNHYYTT